MYHLRLKGDHYQMGVKRGNIFQKAHCNRRTPPDGFAEQNGRDAERAD